MVISGVPIALPAEALEEQGSLQPGTFFYTEHRENQTKSRILVVANDMTRRLQN